MALSPQKKNRVCASCLAVVPEDATQCPKCGGTVFTGDGDKSPLRKVHSFFTITPFHVQAGRPIVDNGELTAIPIEWKLYKARPVQNAPAIPFMGQRRLCVSEPSRVCPCTR